MAFSLFIDFPFALSIKEALLAVEESGLYDLQILKLTADLYPLLLGARPCVCVFSIEEERSSKRVYEYLEGLRNYRISRNETTRDPALRIMLISRGRSTPLEAWMKVGVHEIVIAPILPRAFAFKLARHRDKACAMEPASETIEPVEEHELDEKQNSDGSRTFSSTSPVEMGKEVHLEKIVVKAHIQAFDQDQGEWVVNEATESFEDEWTWIEKGQTSSQKKQWVFKGDKPSYDSSKKTWTFRSESPELALRSSGSLEQVISFSEKDKLVAIRDSEKLGFHLTKISKQFFETNAHQTGPRSKTERKHGPQSYSVESIIDFLENWKPFAPGPAKKDPSFDAPSVSQEGVREDESKDKTPASASASSAPEILVSGEQKKARLSTGSHEMNQVDPSAPLATKKDSEALEAGESFGALAGGDSALGTAIDSKPANPEQESAAGKKNHPEAQQEKQPSPSPSNSSAALQKSIDSRDLLEEAMHRQSKSTEKDDGESSLSSRNEKDIGIDRLKPDHEPMTSLDSLSAKRSSLKDASPVPSVTNSSQLRSATEASVKSVESEDLKTSGDVEKPPNPRKNSLSSKESLFREIENKLGLSKETGSTWSLQTLDEDARGGKIRKRRKNSMATNPGENPASGEGSERTENETPALSSEEVERILGDARAKGVLPPSSGLILNASETRLQRFLRWLKELRRKAIGR